MVRNMLLSAALFLISTSGVALAQQGDPSPQDTQDQKEQQSARETEESSSKDTRIDLTPPADDASKHPQSGAAIVDAESANDVQELQAWDPHKAAKDIEVGDFYFKRKNYRAAMERYKDALVYKPNDAIANFRLAECDEKTGNVKDATSHYETYLKILPHGPFAVEAQKAVDRLKANETKETGAK